MEYQDLDHLKKPLQNGLDNAKIDPKDGYSLWVEEDYYTPLLVMERESVIDRYFEVFQFILLPQKKNE